MNRGELRAYIKTDSHRTTLADELVNGFIRRAEGLIARKLLSTEAEASATLDEDDRVDGGVYTLPSGVLELRRVLYDGRPLEQRSPAALQDFRRLSRPVGYALLGTVVEFAGVPPADAELQLDYYGRLATLEGDSDTNALLTAHEDVYVHAAKMYLYQYTQDRELAADELSAFLEAVDDLNAQARARNNAAAAPAYDFGCGGGY